MTGILTVAGEKKQKKDTVNHKLWYAQKLAIKLVDLDQENRVMCSQQPKSMSLW